MSRVMSHHVNKSLPVRLNTVLLKSVDELEKLDVLLVHGGRANIEGLVPDKGVRKSKGHDKLLGD